METTTLHMILPFGSSYFLGKMQATLPLSSDLVTTTTKGGLRDTDILAAPGAVGHPDTNKKEPDGRQNHEAPQKQLLHSEKQQPQEVETDMMDEIDDEDILLLSYICAREGEPGRKENRACHGCWARVF